MSDIQREAYEDAEAVHSDPFGIWDRDNRNHRKKLELILEATRAEPGDRVLEVGCGAGLHARKYAKKFEYTGVDLMPEFVAKTRARTDDASVLQMDATTLDFADDTFDAVVGTAILHHLADQKLALREWQRVTTTGGSVTLMEPNYLFLKDTVTAHLVPEERHKTGMAPWRLRDTLDAATDSWRLEPRIYTPPWPGSAEPLYDRIDALGQRLPGARWLSQMLRIHIRV